MDILPGLMVQAVGCFRAAQTAVQVAARIHVSLSVRDLRRCRIDGWDVPILGPSLRLMTPGRRIDFAYGPRRENWVVQCDCPAIVAADSPDRFRLRLDDGTWLALPCAVALAPETLPVLVNHFRSILAAWSTGDAVGRLRCRLLLAEVLLRFLGEAPLVRSDAPEEALRRRLDDDARTPIADLCGGLGSADHLARRFRAVHGLSPRAYRQHRRLAEALRLIAGTALPLKAIAARLGFADAAHFAHAFKAATGITPRQAIAKHRLGSA